MPLSPMDALRVIAKQVPLFEPWVVSALVITAGEVALVAYALLGLTRVRDAVVAAKTPTPASLLPPRVWVNALAAAGPAVLLSLLVLSAHLARGRLADAAAAVDSQETVSLLVGCFEGQLNAFPLGILLFVPTAVLACSALSANISANRYASVFAQTAPLPGPEARAGGAAATDPDVSFGCCLLVALSFLVLALGPLLRGVYLYSLSLIKVLASSSGVDPNLKVLMIRRGLEAADLELDRGARLGLVGFALAFLVSAILLLTTFRHSTAARVKVRASDTKRWPWIMSALALAATIAVHVATGPLERENQTPWPPSNAAPTLAISGAPDSPVVGPDPISLGVVVTISTEGVVLDGMPQDAADVDRVLAIHHDNYKLLHPGEPFAGTLIVICKPGASSPRPTLESALSHGFVNLLFAFGTSTEIQRPVIGTIGRHRWTAARAVLARTLPESGATGSDLPLREFGACEDLSDEVVRVRRTQKLPRIAVH